MPHPSDDPEAPTPAKPGAHATPPGGDARADRITGAIEAAGRGEPTAASDLLALLYDELRSLARARLGRIPPGQTLQPTALVHEAWMRIADRRPEGWAGRAQFFHAAARAMRDILVEDARRKAAVKRGGDRRRVDFEGVANGAAAAADVGPMIEPPEEDVAALAAAVDQLAVDHPRAAEIVLLRYFAGLTTEEAATVIGTSTATVERTWRFARAWLRRELDPDAGGDPSTTEAEA